MKTILTLLILLICGSATSLNAQFQNRSLGAPGVQQLIVQYGDELNLTEQQKIELINLQEEFRTDRQRSGIRSDQRQGRFSQRGAVRGDRRSGRQGIRGTGAAFTRSDFDSRWDIRAEHQEEIYNILTDTQIEQLKNLRLDRIEKQHDVRNLRHNAMIERAGLDDNKASEVAARLNRISELQKEMQIQRLENPEEFNRETMQQKMAEIRTIHEELRNTLTVTEYQNLRPGMRAGYGQRGGQQPSGRMFMQRRR